MGDKIHKVLEAMRVYGGEVVSALRKAYLEATPEQKIALEQVFKKYFKEFAAIAEAVWPNGGENGK
jgi:hypothetical protein